MTVNNFNKKLISGFIIIYISFTVQKPFSMKLTGHPTIDESRRVAVVEGMELQLQCEIIHGQCVMDSVSLSVCHS